MLAEANGNFGNLDLKSLEDNNKLGKQTRVQNFLSQSIYGKNLPEIYRQQCLSDRYLTSVKTRLRCEYKNPHEMCASEVCVLSIWNSY